MPPRQFTSVKSLYCYYFVKLLQSTCYCIYFPNLHLLHALWKHRRPHTKKAPYMRSLHYKLIFVCSINFITKSCSLSFLHTWAIQHDSSYSLSAPQVTLIKHMWNTLCNLCDNTTYYPKPIGSLRLGRSIQTRPQNVHNMQLTSN